ncbi:hypothetical protein [Capnocytophaga canis]|uniref:Uncharacterized protein n=1 Tax=Capnocytophaga canis TaxID=1848903 RepID=A0A0B7IWC6_9FLAO|nr:hypothetical protein [Capnocytophaga canis]CEN54412.1 hypothetical protein CCAND93_890003 [Capnocytophaga canis]
MEGIEIDFEKIIEYLTIIGSFIALIISIYSLKETKRMLQYQININKVSQAETYLKENTDLLKLHNIKIEKIQKDDGITKDEFFYILSSLRASEAFYVIGNEKKTFSGYRKNFLKKKKVKVLYKKYLRDNFFSSESFTKMLDEFYSIK